MITITKNFTTIKQAERFQNGLYEKYNSVQLTSFPRFEEAGTYVWHVK